MKVKGSENGAFMDSDVNRMPISEFVEKGFLQEVNRKFFHPLGLTLVVDRQTETGECTLAGIQDCRSDPEGCVYGEGSIFVNQPELAQSKIDSVQREWDRHTAARVPLLGSDVQMIGQIPKPVTETRNV